MRKIHLGKTPLAILALLLVILLCLSHFLYPSARFESAHIAGMGTIVSFTVKMTEGEDGNAVDVLAPLLFDLEGALSHRKEGSVAFRLNMGETVEADAHFLSMLSLCTSVEEKTNGRFSVLLLPLTSLWNFDGDRAVPPGTDEIAEARAAVQGGALRIEGTNVTLTGGALLDLGAVGKGYAADRLADALRARGEEGLIAVGGSITAVGQKDGSAWQVGVRDPHGASINDILGTLALSDLSVSTSGDYEKCFTYEGVSYHHILDPETGYPAQSTLSSVTVIAESGTLADILSTACFLVGEEAALSLARAYGAEIILVRKDGKVIVSQGANALFTPRDGSTVTVR